jgi:hypothetical protein
MQESVDHPIDADHSKEMHSTNDVHISVPSPTQFSVVQPQTWYFFPAFQGIVMVIVLGVWLVRRPSWWLAGALLLSIGFVVWSLRPGSTSYTFAVDADRRVLHAEELTKGTVERKWDVAFADVLESTIQYDHRAIRIALVLRDGTQVFPLGDVYRQDEPGLLKTQALLQEILKDGRVDKSMITGPAQSQPQ